MDVPSYKPKGRLEHRHLLNLLDYSASDIYEIIHLAGSLKNALRKGKKHEFLKGKTVAMIFDKCSTRTRVSFDLGITQLGGHVIFLPKNETRLYNGETVRDTARALSCYGIDGVVMRTTSQSDIDELAQYGDFGVINGISDKFHPCQALSDIFTVYENYGRLNGVKLAYFGDGNNVVNSLMLAGAKTGMNVVICSPECCYPDPDITEVAKKIGNVTVTSDIEQAATGADVIYTDSFFSIGQVQDKLKAKALLPYQVTPSVLSFAKNNAVFMHCLPAHRGEEVTESVIDSTHSIVFKQAENRLHVQKAVMSLLLSK